jgi:uncharacterized protein YxeA
MNSCSTIVFSKIQLKSFFMKTKMMNLPVLAMMIVSSSIFFTSCGLKNDKDYFEKEEYEYEQESEEEEEEMEQNGPDKQLSAWFQAKGYPDASNMTGKYQAAWQQYLAIKENNIPGPGKHLSRTNTTSFGSWTYVGPKVFGGRVLCMAINPQLNAGGNRTIFVGSASGGIWKTYASGFGASAWQKVVTNTQVLGVSSIAYHPSDTSILLAGTGEVYRVETYTSSPYSSDQVSNIGRNAWKARGTYGVGILRSADAGLTWTQVLTKNQSDLFGIQKIKWQPGSSTIVYACATDGLYKSINAGVNWSKIWTGNYCSDIVINAANTQQIVIAAGNVTNNPKGVWRSTDGGTTFTQVTTGGFPAATAYRGYTTLTMLGSSPDTILASVGVGDANLDNTYSERELYRSGDFGSTWASVSNSHHSRYQSWFSHGVTPVPGSTFPRRVFVYGVPGILLTMTGNPATTGSATTVGSSATSSSYLNDGDQEGSGTNYLHSDIHDVQFVPGSTTSSYWATDGGVFFTNNLGTSFTSCNGGLNIAQFYPTLAQSQAVATPNLMIGGLQDNGTIRCNNTTGWARVMGGDGGPALFKPDNETIALASNDTRGVYRSTNTGTSFATTVLTYLGTVPVGYDDRTSFCSPLAVAPSNTNRWYSGSDNIHVSTNAGVSFNNNDASGIPQTAYVEAFHKPALAIGVSPTDANTLYVSVSPFAQNISTDALYYTPPANIRKSTDGGTTFSTVTGTLPDRLITDFAISKTNHDSVFVTVGGFGSAAHVYVSGNGGTTWTPRGSGLPDVPFNTILIDPNDPRIIYAGSDLGVYVSQNRGATWYDYNNGFWDATYVIDLVASPGNKLKAVTHGKGIFESPLFTYLATLPVSITSFTGSHKENYNEIKWITAQEYNLSHYELERSIDGGVFQKVADVPATGNVNSNNYSYNDRATRLVRRYYYRLKSVDLDGSYRYSDVILIEVNQQVQFTVLGNPFDNQLVLRYNTIQSNTLQLSLADMQGRILKRETTIAVAGNNSYAMRNLDYLPAGTYILIGEIDRQRTTIKVVKR